MHMKQLAEEPSLSIREFFAGKNVFLTGSTGFLAKAVVEKLLFDLPEVGRIFLLIRPRRKPNGQEIDPCKRLQEEVLSNSAFGRLRERHGAGFEAFCARKIRCVPGDLTRRHLGLEESAYAELTGQLDVIINSAATVVFDERLDLALTLNTLGPGRLLDMAKASGAIYVHISTCYVSGKRTDWIEEKLMEPMAAIDAQLPPEAPRPASFDVREEIQLLEKLAERIKADCQRECADKKIAPDSEEAKGRLNSLLVGAGMRRAQLFGWNDTYTFTKFLGEQLVHLDRGTVPTVIVRPSIIESGLREPEPGWLDGLRMADPLIIGYGKGRLADFPANPSVVIDIIPADFVVNAILAAAAHISQFPGGFDLFQVASSSKNPLYFRNLYEHVRDCFRQQPFTDKAGRPVATPVWKFPSVAKYRRKMRRRYLVPARLASKLVNGFIPIPGANKWRARLRSKISTLEQLLYYVDIYGPYVNLDCRFETSRCLELLQRIHPEERASFDFDPRSIQWRAYLQEVHIPGLKRNILRMGAPPRAGAGQGRLLEEDADAASRPAVGLAQPEKETTIRERNGKPRPFKTEQKTDGFAPNGEDPHRKSSLRALLDRSPGDTDTLLRAIEVGPSQSALRRIYDFGCGCILKSYLRLRCIGLENVEERAPFVLVSNHCSHLDSAAIRHALGRRADQLHVMAAKDYFFDTGFKSWFFGTFLNALPFNREAHATEGLVICRLVLERGRAVLIYPEGGRSPDGNLQRFKSGIGVLAIELDVPIIPILVSGTYQAWPKSRRFPRPGRIEVCFGKPADLTALKAQRGRIAPSELYRRAASELRAHVQSLAASPARNGKLTT
jgi:1-acyl-sn-glycerol-3-phosphate acyltransferase